MFKNEEEKSWISKVKLLFVLDSKCTISRGDIMTFYIAFMQVQQIWHGKNVCILYHSNTKLR